MLSMVYSKFKEIVLKSLISQDEIIDFCGFDVTGDDDGSALVVLTIALGCFTIGLIVIIIVMCIRRKKEVTYTTPAYISVV
jgi:hypothetical protein